ncbi:MAG: glutamate racemase [Bacteroidota bacterium]
MIENASYIGVFDSGIGGLTVAAEIHHLLPNEAIYYIADNVNAPYGTRAPAEVLYFSSEICRKLISEGAKLIVVACNTATGVAIDQLRKQFPSIPFVGLEPAIKPAANQSSNRRVGVMATELTLSSERFERLINRYGQGIQFFMDPCIGLVPLIESGQLDDPILRQRIKEVLDPMLSAKIDTLVLGCTHYPLVKPIIQNIVGDEVNIINPAAAAARQTARLLEEYNLGNEVSPTSPLHRFHATSSSLPLERALSALRWRNRLVTPNFAINIRARSEAASPH